MVGSLNRGGFIYINVPSTGPVHRAPVDNWRFYEDSGGALASYANKKGYNIELLHASTLPDGWGSKLKHSSGGWGDTVMIFWKEGPFLTQTVVPGRQVEYLKEQFSLFKIDSITRLHKLITKAGYSLPVEDVDNEKDRLIILETAKSTLPNYNTMLSDELISTAEKLCCPPCWREPVFLYDENGFPIQSQNLLNNKHPRINFTVGVDSCPAYVSIVRPHPLNENTVSEVASNLSKILVGCFHNFRWVYDSVYPVIKSQIMVELKADLQNICRNDEFAINGSCFIVDLINGSLIERDGILFHEQLQKKSGVLSATDSNLEKQSDLETSPPSDEFNTENIPQKLVLAEPRNEDVIVTHEMSIHFWLEFANGTKKCNPPGKMCLEVSDTEKLEHYFPEFCVDVLDGTKTVVGIGPTHMIEGRRGVIFNFYPWMANDNLLYQYQVAIFIEFSPYNATPDHVLTEQELLSFQAKSAIPTSNDTFCIATLLYSESYVPGVLALHQSLIHSGMGSYPFMVLTPVGGITDSNFPLPRKVGINEKTVSRLEACGMAVISVEALNFAPGTILPHLGSEIWLKLWLWEVLSHFKRVLYFDADVLVLTDVSELFRLDKFAAARPYSSLGMFLMSPSTDEFQKMVKQLERHDRYAYGEQDFLNIYFRGLRYFLPEGYHCLRGEHNCKIVEFNQLGCALSWKPWMEEKVLVSDSLKCNKTHPQEFWDVHNVWKQMFASATAAA